MELRLAAAILGAPLISAVLWSVGFSLWDWHLRPYDDPFDWSSTVSFGMIAAFVGIPLTASVGSGAHVLLLEFRFTNWLAYAAAGLLTGVGLCVLSGTAFGWGPLAFHLVPVSLLTACLFWLIRRPDRDAPANPPTPAP